MPGFQAKNNLWFAAGLAFLSTRHSISMLPFSLRGVLFQISCNVLSFQYFWRTGSIWGFDRWRWHGFSALALKINEVLCVSLVFGRYFLQTLRLVICMYTYFILHIYIYIIYTCIRCTYVSYDIFIWDPWMHLSWSLSSFIIFEANLNTPITSHLRHVVHICLNVCTWPPCGNPARSRLPMAQIFATETILSSTWRHRRAAAAQLNQRLPRRPKQRCKATQRLRKDYTKPLQSSCKDCSAIGKT